MVDDYNNKLYTVLLCFPVLEGFPIPESTFRIVTENEPNAKSIGSRLVNKNWRFLME